MDGMTYSDVVRISQSSSLRTRCVAAAASEPNVGDPERLVDLHWWAICAQPGWAEAWAYARSTSTVNVNPDTGLRDDVINDSMILAAIQAVNPAAAQE